MKSHCLTSLLFALVLILLNASPNLLIPTQTASASDAESSSLPVSEKTNRDAETIQNYIERSLDIGSDETLPRGVKKLHSVSIKSDSGRQITVRWALNDWMHWAGEGMTRTLEGGANRDIFNILRGIVHSKVAFSTIHLEGTLPIEGGMPDNREHVVIEAVYERTKIEECNFKGNDYFDVLTNLRDQVEKLKELEKAQDKNQSKGSGRKESFSAPEKKKITVSPSNILRIAKSHRIHPELRKKYL